MYTRCSAHSLGVRTSVVLDELVKFIRASERRWPQTDSDTQAISTRLTPHTAPVRPTRPQDLSAEPGSLTVAVAWNAQCVSLHLHGTFALTSGKETRPKKTQIRYTWRCGRAVCAAGTAERDGCGILGRYVLANANGSVLALDDDRCRSVMQSRSRAAGARGCGLRLTGVFGWVLTLLSNGDAKAEAKRRDVQVVVETRRRRARERAASYNLESSGFGYNMNIT